VKDNLIYQYLRDPVRVKCKSRDNVPHTCVVDALHFLKCVASPLTNSIWRRYWFTYCR